MSLMIEKESPRADVSRENGSLGARTPASGLYFLALVGAVGFLLGFLAPLLIYRDLNLDYPFPNGDFHDWIANGLFLAGEDVRYSVRPPLLPALIAALDALGGVSLLPVVTLLALAAAAFASFLLVCRLHSPSIAFATALVIAFNHGFLLLAMSVNVDVIAAALLSCAIFAFVLARERPRAYLACGLLAAASALTQQAALLLLAPVAATLWLFRRQHLRSGWLWTGALSFVVAIGAWFAVKRWVFGTAADVVVQHWSLLGFHGDGLVTYLWSTASLIGLPATALLAIGLVRCCSSLRHDGDRFFLFVSFATLFFFFATFYEFHATRFLLYPLVSSGFFLSEALTLFAKPAVFRTLVVIVLLGSMWPNRGEPGDATRVAVWPLPPIYLKAGIEPEPFTGSYTLQPARSTWERLSLHELQSSHALARAVRARKRHIPRASVDRQSFQQDSGAFFFYRSVEEERRRYVTTNRLGNALRKKVKFLPAAFLEDFHRYMSLEVVGRLADYQILRARPRGIDESWLMVFSGALPAIGPSRSAQPSQEFLTAFAETDEISRFVGATEAVVIVLVDDAFEKPTLFFLSFMLKTTNLFYVEAHKIEETRQFLAPARALAEKPFGKLLLRRLLLDGTTAYVIERRKSVP